MGKVNTVLKKIHTACKKVVETSAEELVVFKVSFKVADWDYDNYDSSIDGIIAEHLSNFLDVEDDLIINESIGEDDVASVTMDIRFTKHGLDDVKPDKLLEEFTEALEEVGAYEVITEQVSITETSANSEDYKLASKVIELVVQATDSYDADNLVADFEDMEDFQDGHLDDFYDALNILEIPEDKQDVVLTLVWEMLEPLNPNFKEI